MKNHKLLILIIVGVFVGALAAMLAWTLIVKNQLSATLATESGSPLGKILGL